MTNLESLHFGGDFRTFPAGLFEDLSSLKKLQIGGDWTSIPAGIFDGLASLEELDMEARSLRSLPVGLFNDLTSLQTLEFSAPLTSIPEDVFRGLTSLKTLIFRQLQLTTLPTDVFKGLSSLKSLEMNGSSIDALPPGLFRDLTGLKGATLYGIGLRSISSGAFEGAGNMTHLNLNQNLLTGLPAGVFRGLSSLQYLGLEDNPLLRTLEAGAFEGLDGLEDLDLSRKQLANLPAGAFDGLTSLRDLNLRDNSLETLPAGAFDGLPNLRFLHLTDNLLESVSADAFERLTSLVDLFLGDNLLESVPAGVFEGLTSLERLHLDLNQLAALPAGVFDGLTSLKNLRLRANQFRSVPQALNGLASLETLYLDHIQLETLPAHAFDGLTSLRELYLSNPLTSISVGAFRGLENLKLLELGNNLSTWPAGAFEGLGNVTDLSLGTSRVTSLPAGAFRGLTSLGYLYVSTERLTTLPAGVFEGLTSLETLFFGGFSLAVLPAGVFRGLANLKELTLRQHQLRSLSADTFEGLTNLEALYLDGNRLVTLPADVFEGLGNLKQLWLYDNQLATLPAGVFEGLSSLSSLALGENHLVGLSRDHPLFAGLHDLIKVDLGGQVELPAGVLKRHFVAVPLFISASDSARQEFVRIINESDRSGAVRIYAVDDGGTAANPIDIPLRARQAIHLNSDELEDGNAGKGFETGVGRPAEGDWRLDVETALDVRVLAYVRTGDGFLTAMHDVLDRPGSQSVMTFNPASNTSSVSKLRLVNPGAHAVSVSISGRDDASYGANPSNGSVRLMLPPGESRTLSAHDLEQGAGGLTGALGDGVGKWHLRVTVKSDHLFGDAGPVRVMNLLESASGHLSNLSSLGHYSNYSPFFISASDSLRQGFVRIINEIGSHQSVRIDAFDDGGRAAGPVDIPTGEKIHAVHFNAGDLEDGNAEKGIETGIGRPAEGDWRLSFSRGVQLRALTYVRTGDGFLTAMHDTLQEEEKQVGIKGWRSWLVVPTFNPARNTTSVSKLRLVNLSGDEYETVFIEGIDDNGDVAGPLTLMLAPGESRTLSALDLEQGAAGLTGALGQGTGKWRLHVTGAEQFVDDDLVGMSLLYSASGHVTNISTKGFFTKEQ